MRVARRAPALVSRMLPWIPGMKPEGVKAVLGDLPYMTLEQGKALTEFLHETKSRKVLELGFYHGVSSCYLGAAMKEARGEPIVTIDLISAKHRTPNIEELVKKCQIEEYVEYYYEPTSYNWRLMKFIEFNDRKFDFCFIDGGHDWYNTGFCFFLVDKLLENNGWILFDDLDWKMENIKKPWAQKRPLDERRTAQVRKVWELLVKQHPAYGEFREEGRWAFAKKVA
jgi:predicted O-methyltransferase YrrM